MARNVLVGYNQDFIHTNKIGYIFIYSHKGLAQNFHLAQILH